MRSFVLLAIGGLIAQLVDGSLVFSIRVNREEESPVVGDPSTSRVV